MEDGIIFFGLKGRFVVAAECYGIPCPTDFSYSLPRGSEALPLDTYHVFATTRPGDYWENVFMKSTFHIFTKMLEEAGDDRETLQEFRDSAVYQSGTMQMHNELDRRLG